MRTALDATIDRLRKGFPSLATTLGLLPSLPISWRKEIIRCCQVGEVDYDEFKLLYQEHPVPRHPNHPDLPVNHQWMEFFLEPCLVSPMAKSLIWMHCRTVPEPKNDDQSLDVRLATLEKEFSASQNVFSDTASFDWSPLHGRMDYPLSNFIDRRLGQVIHNFYARLKRIGRIYPKIQRVKNVSQETALIYRQLTGAEPETEVTTSMLELFYGQTGYQIPGACEIRNAWKFNDLKPRFYYAQGGRDYFASRYFKKITTVLMESVPETQMRVRTDPAAFLEGSVNLYMTTWDFTAFTTSLSELKFFLNAIAIGLENLQADAIELFDYHVGQVWRLPSELIDEYNEAINVQSPFLIHRISQYFQSEDFDDLEVFHQQNSGMLGVAGNIGLSTACHGSVITQCVEEGHGVCVGDDGLGIGEDPPEIELIPTIRYLGNIHIKKFDVRLPGEERPLRFLKRGVRRIFGRLEFDLLLDFPISAYIDKEYGSRTVPPNLDEFLRYKKVVVQISKLLWDVYDHGSEIGPGDIRILSAALDAYYDLLKLPRAGTFTFRVPNYSYRGTLVVPPIRFDHYDPRLLDWLEFLFNEEPDSAMSVPVYTPAVWEVEKPDVGDTLFLSKQPIWKIFEDMGLVKLEEVREQVVYWNEENRRRVAKMLGRIKSPDDRELLCITVLAEIPEKFHYLFTSVLALGDLEAIWEHI